MLLIHQNDPAGVIEMPRYRLILEPSNRWFDFDAVDDEAAKQEAAKYKDRIIEGYMLIECRTVEEFTVTDLKVVAAAALKHRHALEAELGNFPPVKITKKPSVSADTASVTA